MIPAPPGLAAEYEYTASDGLPGHRYQSIAAFDEDGAPLFAEGERSLTGRHGYEGYTGMAMHPHAHIVAIMPSGGWRVRWTDPDGTKGSEPLVGWALRANGEVVALHCMDGIDVEDLTRGNRNSRTEVYHPDLDYDPPVTPAT